MLSGSDNQLHHVRKFRNSRVRPSTLPLVEGIRTLEIPAPYYGDRLRRQFPPSSRVLTLALFCLHSYISQLFRRDTCYTQRLDILMSMERTSELFPGRYMDIAATFYYIRKVILFIMSVSTQLNPHGHHQ